jgi:hypothetical protein
MQQRVGLATVPAAARDDDWPQGRYILFVPGAMSRQGLPDPNNKSGDAPPALTARAGSDGPTARARAEGKPGLRTPVFCVGERLATDKRHPGYTVLQCASFIPLPLPMSGEGEEAEGETLL